MDAELIVASELGNIDQQVLWWAGMSVYHMDRILQRPLLIPTFAQQSSVSTASGSQYLGREDKGSNMACEISEFGWTMYLDQSLDNWNDENTTSQFDIKLQPKFFSHNTTSQFDIKLQPKFFSHNTDDAGRCRTYDYQGSSITGKKEDSSIVSDASSGPQKLPLPLPLPLPVQDIEFEKDRQAARSYSLVSRRKRGAHEDLESIASCSSVDVNHTRNKFRKVKKIEDDHEIALFLQDTASSHIHEPEVQEVNTRFEVLQSLSHDGAKVRASSETNFQ